MKMHKNSILIALAILLIIGIAKAEVPMRIGLTSQPDPFESNPTASTTSGNYISPATATAVTTIPTGAFSVSGAASAKDQDLTTPATLTLRTTSAAVNDRGDFHVKNFETDASAPAITQVDLRIRYSYTAGSPAANFQYNITADLGSGTVSTLVANTGTTAALSTVKFDALAKPGGGAWAWANIGTLRIRFAEKRLVLTGTLPTYRVYEVWLRVICSGKPLPPPGANVVTNAYDGKIDTNTQFGGFRESTGYIAFKTFTQPSVDPTWVDFKVKYTYSSTPDTASTGDKYRITYYVGATGPTVLQDWTNASYPGVVADTLAQDWFNQPDALSGGAWTAADVGAVEVRLETQIVGDEDMATWNINEVWLSCYSSSLPPVGSTAMSIVPQVIPALTAGDIFFVDIYIRDFVGIQGGLAGWQFNITVDPNEVKPAGTPTGGGGFTYWPFTDQAAYDFQLDHLHMSYTIPSANPLFTTGMPGTDFAIARVYFIVVATTTNYSPLTFSVSFIGDQGANKIAHAVYHGFYNPPAGTSLVQWVPASPFPYGDPSSTNWIEQYPNMGNRWHLTSWTDNGDPNPGDGILNPSDQVDMTPTDPSGLVQWFHVDHVWTTDTATATYVYMILTAKGEIPEFPLGIGILMAIVPLIPIAYLWRTRRKVIKK